MGSDTASESEISDSVSEEHDYRGHGTPGSIPRSICVFGIPNIQKIVTREYLENQAVSLAEISENESFDWIDWKIKEVYVFVRTSCDERDLWSPFFSCTVEVYCENLKAR